jgi:N-acetylglucosamine-6-phosphate deacetylase
VVTSRLLLSGAALVLPDRIATGHTLVIEGGRIADIVTGPRQIGAGERRIDLDGRTIVPGFVDVHVHGAAGIDVLDGPGAVSRVAALLPRWGVTAFCPTSIACAPEALAGFLADVARARGGREPFQARVLGAHLESNFINPEYRGAQPLACLRTPRLDGDGDGAPGPATAAREAFSARDILGVVDHHRADVGIVTMAPELPGGTELVRALAAAGVRVSLGHSAATFDEAQGAIAAGARHATHLFNRMPPMTHREPGLAGAVLASEDVAAELICDGHHVHPAFMRMAVAAKRPARIMAITDGTAGSGLPQGARAHLGGRPIVVREVARLDDGTMAGSVATMDRVFGCLVSQVGVDLRSAVEMCATTPAREMGMVGHGVLGPGAVADFVVLDPTLAVVETWIAGTRAWPQGE